MEQTLNEKCPVCFTTEPKNFAFVERVEKVLRLQCTICKTIFFDSTPLDQPVYDMDYNLHFFRLEDIRKAGIMANFIGELAKVLYESPNILEAGTGNGMTVFLLRAMGFDTIGLDIDVKWCRYLFDRFRIPVEAGKFEYFNPSTKFDVIYSSHVIEHCKEPHTFFLKAYDLLNEGGIFILDTPDTQANGKTNLRWHHFETRNPYEHCSLLGMPGIKLLAQKNGFRIAHLRFNPLYMSSLGVFVKGDIKLVKTIETFPSDESARETIAEFHRMKKGQIQSPL